MARSLSRLTSNPAELITVLNDMMAKDKMENVFALSYLVLYPKTNELRYISCGYGQLWHLVPGMAKPVQITTDNVALGIDPHMQFIDTTRSWNDEDILLISTVASNPSAKEDSEVSEKIFHDLLIENITEQPQKIVDSIHRKLRLSSTNIVQERTLTFICIKRT